MKIKLITLQDVKIDTSYQRATSTRANKIASQWDYRLYRPIVVNIRSNGETYCLDGAHRLMAMRILNKTTAMAEVFENLTAEEEAYIYSNQSINSKPLQPIDIFKANLFRGKESDEDVQLNKAVTLAGGKVASYQHQPGWFCISYLRQLYRKGGASLITFVTTLAQRLQMSAGKENYPKHVACLGSYLYANNETDIDSIVKVFGGLTLNDCKVYAIINKVELSTSTSSSANSNLLIKVYLRLKETQNEAQ